MEALGDLPIFLETMPWEEVQAALEAEDLGDGLPLVPPTPTWSPDTGNMPL